MTNAFRNLDKASFAAAALDVGADVHVAAVVAKIASTALLETLGGGDGGTNLSMDMVVVSAEMGLTAIPETVGGDGGTNMGMDVAVVAAENASATLLAISSWLG